MIGTVARAGALAAAVGERSMTPLAALSWAAATGRLPLRRFPYRLLASPFAARGLWLCAIGEMVVDKLPFTPSRIAPGPLTGRVIIGGIVAGTLFESEGRSPVGGTLLGGVVSGAQCFAGYSVRMALNRRLPNPVSGLVGDVAALGLSLSAVARRNGRWLW